MWSDEVLRASKREARTDIAGPRNYEDIYPTRHTVNDNTYLRRVLVEIIVPVGHRLPPLGARVAVIPCALHNDACQPWTHSQSTVIGHITRWCNRNAWRDDSNEALRSWFVVNTPMSAAARAVNIHSRGAIPAF